MPLNRRDNSIAVSGEYQGGGRNALKSAGQFNIYIDNEFYGGYLNCRNALKSAGQFNKQDKKLALKGITHSVAMPLNRRDNSIWEARKNLPEATEFVAMPLNRRDNSISILRTFATQRNALRSQCP